MLEYMLKLVCWIYLKVLRLVCDRFEGSIVLSDGYVEDDEESLSSSSVEHDVEEEEEQDLASVYASAEGQYEEDVPTMDEEVPTMDEEVPISEEYLAFMAETQRCGSVQTFIIS